MERILVIAAHPDDEVLGMGGTIAKYAKYGNEVAVLIVTDGSTSQYRNDPKLQDILRAKKIETTNCAAVLGVKHVFYGELPDMRLDVTPHVEINRVIPLNILIVSKIHKRQPKSIRTAASNPFFLQTFQDLF